MSSIEHLKKQAKQVVRWHRERHWTVAQIIREHLEDFGEMSDRQILDHPFQLAEAQLLIARQEGFDSWADLKNGTGQRALPSTSGSRRLLSVQPFLYVSDIGRACDY